MKCRYGARVGRTMLGVGLLAILLSACGGGGGRAGAEDARAGEPWTLS